MEPLTKKGTHGWVSWIWVIAPIAIGCSATGRQGRPAEAAAADKPRPQLVRIESYSPPVYASFVGRSVSHEAIADQMKAASIPVTLIAREADAFEDDYYSDRKGSIVILGTEGKSVVGFTSRWLVDYRYPDVDLYQDGVGSCEFREHWLDLHPVGFVCGNGRACSDRYQLKETTAPAADLRFPSNGIAYYRTFGDNDIALVYFPRLQDTYFANGLPAGALDIKAPTAMVSRRLREATSLFGQDFLLISRESLKKLREVAHVDSSLSKYGSAVISTAASLFGIELGPMAKLAIDAGIQLIDASNGDRLEEAVDGLEVSGLRPIGFPADVAGARVRTDDLLLVDVPDEHRAAIQEAIARMPSSLQRVSFGDRESTSTRALVFAPAEHRSLNYDLVRGGLARLDAGNIEALELFPEMLDAANDALMDGAGFAAAWRNEATYRSALLAARAALRDPRAQ